MSFRITTARIEFMVAKALDLLALRPAPTPPVVYAEDSTERKYERALKMASAHFADGHRKGIGMILAEVMGITAEVRDTILGVVPGREPVNPLKHGDAIVLLANPSSHSYPQNEVLFVCAGDGGVPNRALWLRDGELERGNCLPYQLQAYWRYATAEEINAAKDKMLAPPAALGDEDALVRLFK